MKYIDNDAAIVCCEDIPDQLVQHDEMNGCERCWEQFASDWEYCRCCGEYVGSSRYSLCDDCSADEHADYLYERRRG